MACVCLSIISGASAGGSNHLPVSSLTGLLVDADYLLEPQQGLLRRGSIGGRSVGLGFLKAWQPRGSQTSYVAAQDFKGQCP